MKKLLTIALAALCLGGAPRLGAAPSADIDELRQIEKQARTHRNRYKVIKATVSRYDPAKTNLFVRPARASMQTKLTNARDEARRFYAGFTNQLAHTSVYSNAMIRAELRAVAATNRLAKIESFLEAKRDAAKLSTTKALYQAILDALKED